MCPCWLACQLPPENKLFVRGVPRDDCAICLEPLSRGRLAAQRKCEHLFHASCLEEYGRHRPCAPCPLCRCVSAQPPLRVSLVFI